MGGFEALTPVGVEPTLEYHPHRIGSLTLDRYPASGQCLVGSLTGAVASQNVTEARVRSAQNGWQSFVECKSISRLDCETHTSSRDESRL